MTKEEFNTYINIDNFIEKLGEEIIEAVMEEDNFSYEISKSVISVFDSCTTNQEFEIADKMLIAICGYSINTLIENIKDKDAKGHIWESC